MTQHSSLTGWPRGEIQTFWTEEIDRSLTVADVERLEDELELNLWGIHKPEEYTVGARLLDPPREDMLRLIRSGATEPGAVMLVARRRHGEGKEFLTRLPGIAIELTSTVGGDTPDRWEDLRTKTVGLLGQLGLASPRPGERALLTAED